MEYNSVNSKITYPYSDRLMIWDETERRYFLTPEALKINGIDVEYELDSNSAVNTEKIINRLIRYTSTMIYNYIHEHSLNNCIQDTIIATVPSIRSIIYRALLSQAEYLMLQGDLTRSLSIEHRKFGIDYEAKKTLETTVTEIGRSILYTGG